MTPWVLRLIVANVVVTVLTLQSDPLWAFLVLSPRTLLVQPWTLVSHMFMHAGTWHIVANMIGLFFFGPRIEALLGSRSFLRLYFGAGFAGAVLSLLAYPLSPFVQMVGASGAVLGVVVAFATQWPHERIYLYALIPIPARVLAVVIVVWSLWAGLTNVQGSVAHFGHLGGAVFGWAYLRYAHWRRAAARRDFQRRLDPGAGMRRSDSAARRRWEAIDLDTLHEINREEVEKLLEKVRASGPGSLTPQERAFLERISRV